MKTNFFYLLLAGTVILSSCGSEGNGDDKKTPDISFESTAPKDFLEIELDAATPNEELTFEWEAKAGVKYSLVLSLEEEMYETKSFEMDDSGSFSFTYDELDEMADEIGITDYKGGEIFWKIAASLDGATAESDFRSMELLRMLKPFVDPRDGEEYKVVRVVDELTGSYAVWMAENMRATEYADGTKLEVGTDVKFYSAETVTGGATTGDDTWSKLRGGYYTFTAAVRGIGAEDGETVQGIAPDGWHVASDDDWVFLINAQEDQSAPGIILKSADYWDANASVKGEDNIGFNVVATGYIAAPIADNSIIESDNVTYFWFGDKLLETDEFPWSPDPANFPYQGGTYAMNASDKGMARYPYWSGNGMCVRCVLD